MRGPGPYKVFRLHKIARLFFVQKCTFLPPGPQAINASPLIFPENENLKHLLKFINQQLLSYCLAFGQTLCIQHSITTTKFSSANRPNHRPMTVSRNSEPKLQLLRFSYPTEKTALMNYARLMTTAGETRVSHAVVLHRSGSMISAIIMVIYNC